MRTLRPFSAFVEIDIIKKMDYLFLNAFRFEHNNVFTHGCLFIISLKYVFLCKVWFNGPA